MRLKELAKITRITRRKVRLLMWRETRQSVFERDGWSCYLCGRDVDCFEVVGRKRVKVATVDHIVPKSRGGGDTPDNLRTCCQSCNFDRGTAMPDRRVLYAVGWLDQFWSRVAGVTELS